MITKETFLGKEGLIITSRHGLEGANSAQVKTEDGKMYSIKEVLAEDNKSDLILLSVDIPNEAVHPLTMHDTLPDVGERIIVIGSPLGLEKTVSDGIVSAIREIPAFGRIIQITAPISPGSSGSPVVNMKGEVIGVVKSQMLKGQNLNFAIPIEKVSRLKREKAQTLVEWTAGGKDSLLTTAEKLYSKGLAFVWAEDYEKALTYFEDAVNKDSNHFEAYFQIGYCYSKLTQYKHAVKAFKQTIQIKPDYFLAHNNLCFAYGNLGLYQEAIEACKQAIRIKPDFPDAHYNLGLTYGYLGQPQEEIECYKQAIRFKSGYAEAHYNLGITYLQVGDKGSALDEYKILKDLNKDLANKLFNKIYK
jgi:Tfp pilus assembly protein PilF